MCFGMFFFRATLGSLSPLGFMWCTLFFRITVIFSFFFALHVYSTFQQHIKGIIYYLIGLWVKTTTCLSCLHNNNKNGA